MKIHKTASDKSDFQANVKELPLIPSVRNSNNAQHGIKRNFLKMERDINDIILLDYMDVNLINFEKLKPLRKKIIDKLGEIEVLINYYKQSKFRYDKIAQKNLIVLKDSKKHFTNMKNKVDERIKDGL